MSKNPIVLQHGDVFQADASLFITHTYGPTRMIQQRLNGEEGPSDILGKHFVVTEASLRGKPLNAKSTSSEPDYQVVGAMESDAAGVPVKDGLRVSFVQTGTGRQSYNNQVESPVVTGTRNTAAPDTRPAFEM